MFSAMADSSADADWRLDSSARIVAPRSGESPRVDPRTLARGGRILERGLDPPLVVADADNAAASRMPRALPASVSSPGNSRCRAATSYFGENGTVKSTSLRGIPVTTACGPSSAVASRTLASATAAMRGHGGSATAPRVGASVRRHPSDALTLQIGDKDSAIRGGVGGDDFVVMWEERATPQYAPHSDPAIRVAPCARDDTQPRRAVAAHSSPAIAAASPAVPCKRAGNHRRSLSCPSQDMAELAAALPPTIRMSRCSASSNNLALLATSAATATPNAASRHTLAASAAAPLAGSPPLVGAGSTAFNRRGPTPRQSGGCGGASFPPAAGSPDWIQLPLTPTGLVTLLSPLAFPATPSGLPPRSRKPAAVQASAFPQPSPRKAPSLGEPAMAAREDERLRATSPQGLARQAMAGGQRAREGSPRMAVAAGRQGALSPSSFSPGAASSGLIELLASPKSIPVLNLPSEAGRVERVSLRKGESRRVISNVTFSNVAGSAGGRLPAQISDDGSDSDDEFVGLYQTVTQRRAMVSAAHHVLPAAGSVKTGAEGPQFPGVGCEGSAAGLRHESRGRQCSRRTMSADFHLSPSWALEAYDTAKCSRAAERRELYKGVGEGYGSMQQGWGTEGSDSSAPSSSRSSSNWSSGDSSMGSSKSIGTPFSSSSSIQSVLLDAECFAGDMAGPVMTRGPQEGEFAGFSARVQAHGRAMEGAWHGGSRKSVKFIEAPEWI